MMANPKSEPGLKRCTFVASLRRTAAALVHLREANVQILKKNAYLERHRYKQFTIGNEDHLTDLKDSTPIMTRNERDRRRGYEDF